MFFQVPFDSADDVPSMEEDSLLQTGSDAMAGGVVRLHRPGEDGFACVAGATDDVSARYDARHLSGDSWLCNECHCLQCETIRVSSKLSKLQMKGSCKKAKAKEKAVVVLLLDLDNYGFNHFKSVPPRGKSHTTFDVTKHLFVWCFFGSCFVRHHGSHPDAETVCQCVPGSDLPKGGNSCCRARKTVWQRLVADGRCHFTPCGGQRQAVDDVMLQVAHAMTHVPLIVLSGDRNLLQTARGCRRAIGKKARREDVDLDLSSELDIISAADYSKRFLPVWLVLSEKVYCIVHG